MFCAKEVTPLKRGFRNKTVEQNSSMASTNGAVLMLDLFQSPDNSMMIPFNS